MPSVYLQYPAVDPRMPVVVPVPEPQVNYRDWRIVLPVRVAVGFTVLSILQRIVELAGLGETGNFTPDTPVIRRFLGGDNSVPMEEIAWPTHLLLIAASIAFCSSLGWVSIIIATEVLNAGDRLLGIVRIEDQPQWEWEQRQRR
ncbi:hypothetical protein CMUS01_12190 [Colletotrichum musicola]|uniref:Uncharacterized protein n=1 Tax=Colletotrichum musicola TaxID=2175873 RepID=A0A8H6N1H8_9PEZI|nr:hypothetical protein CMUS01_12190 [Colletotrichum musicola]